MSDPRGCRHPAIPDRPFSHRGILISHHGNASVHRRIGIFHDGISHAAMRNIDLKPMFLKGNLVRIS
jgi:hypothetical protein